MEIRLLLNDMELTMVLKGKNINMLFSPFVGARKQLQSCSVILHINRLDTIISALKLMRTIYCEREGILAAQ